MDTQMQTEERARASTSPSQNEKIDRELLMLQVEHSELPVADRPERISRNSEVDTIYHAKTIIEKSIDNPPSIRELARLVGLNEFSLKKSFRDTFQTTIYGYANELKMEQAR